MTPGSSIKVPALWQVEPLGRHAEVKARIGWRGLSSDEYTSDGPYLIAGQHLAEGRVCWEFCDHISEYRYEESKEIALRNGDIIITKDGTIGRVAKIEQLPGKATLNGTMMLVRPKRTLDFRYLYHSLSGQTFRKLIEDKVSGSSIPHLFQRDMVGLPVTLPPPSEQARIADVLDTLDEAIQGSARVVEKLEHSRQGAIRELLRCGLDRTGRVRWRGDRSLFKDTPIGPRPKDWSVAPLSDLLDSRRNPAMRSGPFGSALLKQDLVEEGHPLIGIDNVQAERFVPIYTRFITPAKFSDLSRYRSFPNDVLITIMGTVGRCCLVPEGLADALTTKHVWALSVDPELYSPFLVCLQINYAPWVLRHLNGDQQGGIMSAIRAETLRSVLLPVPPKEEREAIEAVLRSMGEAIGIEQQRLHKLQALKSGLSTDLLTGHIRTQ